MMPAGAAAVTTTFRSWGAIGVLVQMEKLAQCRGRTRPGPTPVRFATALRSSTGRWSRLVVCAVCSRVSSPVFLVFPPLLSLSGLLRSRFRCWDMYCCRSCLQVTSSWYGARWCNRGVGCQLCCLLRDCTCCCFCAMVDCCGWCELLWLCDCRVVAIVNCCGWCEWIHWLSCRGVAADVIFWWCVCDMDIARLFGVSSKKDASRYCSCLRKLADCCWFVAGNVA